MVLQVIVRARPPARSFLASPRTKDAWRLGSWERLTINVSTHIEAVEQTCHKPL